MYSTLLQDHGDQVVTRPDQDTRSKADKYKNSALTSEMSARILNRLTTTIAQQKPYLKNNLTLPELAEMVSTSPR